MKRITKAGLERLVDDLVPDVYKPQPDLSSTGYVRAIILATPEYIKSITGTEDVTQGLTINTHTMFKSAGIKEELLQKWHMRFIIVINNTLKESVAKFVLLHEIGHVDDIVKSSSLSKACINKMYDSEFYAEMYAVHTLSNKYDIHTALALQTLANKVDKVD